MNCNLLNFVANIVAVHFNRGMMYIRFVGTHSEYDAINVGKV